MSTGAVALVAANKHQQRTEATKRKLLKAAYAVFARDGFEASRIEDIAKQAGYTRGAFYAHFSTKEDLFLALLEQQTAEHVGQLRLLLDRCKDAESIRRTLRDYYIGRSKDRRWAILILEFKLYTLRRSGLRAKIAESYQRIHALKIAILGDVLLRPERRDGSSEIRRAGLEATLTGLVLERAYDPKRISDAEVQWLLGEHFDALVP